MSLEPDKQPLGCPIDDQFFAMDNIPLVWTVLFLIVIAPFLFYLFHVLSATPPTAKKAQTVEIKKAIGKSD
jgi:hypothetical protein